MALIKCSECGQTVSDKAAACPNCGCPISQDKGRICEECGTQIPLNVSTCPNCGCPIDYREETYVAKTTNKKWIYVILGFLCVGVISLLLIYGINQHNYQVAEAARADSIKAAQIAQKRIEDSLRQVKIEEERQIRMEEERKREEMRRAKLRFVGTYSFQACRSDYRATYETDFTKSGGVTVKKTGYNTPDGHTSWVVYMVVHDDGRVVKIEPKREPEYLGKIKVISSSAFTVVDSDIKVHIGEYADFYKGDNHNIGTLGGNGYKLWDGVVFDLNEGKAYKNMSEYDNRDIQASEYIKFTHSKRIEASNNSEYIKEGGRKW